MRIELQRLHREINATMIYVTHDQVEAMTLGNRIAVLNKGQLMQIDTPMNLYNHPHNKFVAGFIGSPTMNFIKGFIKHDSGYYFIHEDSGIKFLLGTEIPIALKNHINIPVEIGIRPEDIFISENNIDKPDCNLKIMAFENMGNEQLVYFSLSNQTLIARRTSRDNLELNAEKGITFSKNNIIYFDEGNGNVLFEIALA
jgi:multiple sugar transport system ATP-binding protein